MDGLRVFCGYVLPAVLLAVSVWARCRHPDWQ